MACFRSNSILLFFSIWLTLELSGVAADKHGREKKERLRKFIKAEEIRMINKTMHYDPDFDCDDVPGITFHDQGLCYSLHKVHTTLTCAEAEAQCGLRGGTLIQYSTAGVGKALHETALDNHISEVLLGMVYNEKCEMTVLPARAVTKADHGNTCDPETVSDNPCVKLHLGPQTYYTNDKCETSTGYACILLTSNKRKVVRRWQKMVAYKQHKVQKYKNPANINQALAPEERDVELCYGDVPCLGDEKEQPGARRKRSAINPYVMNLHHKGVICYKIVDADRNYTVKDKEFIVKTLDELSGKCCVQFREFSTDDPDCKNHYVRIFNGGGCYSYVGKVNLGSTRSLNNNENQIDATYQNISLYDTTSGTCLTSSIITHEMLHCIGFWHEHTRPDRDDYIDVLLDNVYDWAESNFIKRSNDDSLQYAGPYDVNSVMHYKMDDFMNPDIGECCTILDADKKYSEDDSAYFGHGEISNEDINKCNRLYEDSCSLRNDGSVTKPFIESWGSWCSWGPCSAKCGSGTRVRRRYCNKRNGCKNIGNDFEEEECSTHRCPRSWEPDYRHLGNFRMAKQPATEWILHPITDIGSMATAKKIAACASAALEQGVSRFGMMAGDCYIDNNTSLSGAYPYVTESGLGEMTIDGIYGALDVYRVVDKDAAPVPLSQIQSYWGSWCGWTACSQTCGNKGFQERHRSCLTPNGSPDAKCLGRGDTEARECGRQKCNYMCGDQLCLHGDCDLATETCSNCEKGFYGQFCILDMEVCECCESKTFGAEYPRCADVTPEMCCSANSTCMDRPGLEKQCFCDDGFYDIYFDGMKCEPESCIHDDNCTAKSNLMVCNMLSGRCQCTLGYSLDKNLKCIDHNECDLNIDECPENSNCQNTVGSFSCNCVQGYELIDSTCVDIDECARNIDLCDVNAVCTNVQGSYQCGCDRGFTGDGLQCQDIDECVADNGGCDENADCLNLIGAHKCACKTGFFGDGFNCIEESSDCSSMPAPKYTVNLASLSQTRHSGDVVVHTVGGINGAYVEFPEGTGGSVDINRGEYDTCIHAPQTCANGLSVSIGFQLKQGSTNSGAEEKEEVLFSTGPEPRMWPTLMDSLGIMGYYNKDKLVVVVHVLRADNAQGWEYVSSIPADLIDDNKAHLLTLTWVARLGSRVYLDGNLRDDDQVGQASGTTSVSSRWHFGSHPNRDGNYYNGDISSVSMWDYPVDEETIQKSYKCSIKNVCSLDLCHSDAICSDNKCTCKSGYDGDGFVCQKIQEETVQSLPDPWHSWSLSPQSKNNLGEFSAIHGDVNLLSDSRHNEDLLFVAGPHPGQKAIMCDGSQDALKADTDFDDTCIGVPDECNDGFTIIWDMRFDGSGMKAPIMRSNWIISSGAHAGSNTTGISVAVRGPEFRAEVQLKDRRLEATAPSLPLIGNWKHIAVTYDGLSTVSIFYNGQNVGTSIIKDVSAPAKGNHALTFCRPNGCFAFMCRADIANVIFYGTELNGQQIQSIYQYGVYGTDL